MKRKERDIISGFMYSQDRIKILSKKPQILITKKIHQRTPKEPTDGIVHAPINKRNLLHNPNAN